MEVWNIKSMASIYLAKQAVSPAVELGEPHTCQLPTPAVLRSMGSRWLSRLDSANTGCPLITSSPKF